MKSKISLTISCLAILCPIISVIINIFFEPEIIEAIIGGLIIGCFPGTLFGVIAIFLNKERHRMVKILSIIPMVPIGIYLLLAIPYLFYK